MKVFYINLKKRKDRKDHMEKMLSNLNLDYQRFEAICPTIHEIKFGKYKKLIEEKATPTLKKLVNNKEYNARAIVIVGCYLSHLYVHESQIGNHEPYMILEDDVKITEKTIKELKEIMGNKKYKDWDMITSKYFSTESVQKIETVPYGSKFRKQYSCFSSKGGGSHFVVFKNVKKIMKFMSSENLLPVDTLYNTCVVNTYHTKLDVSIECSVQSSDIQKRIK